MRGFNPLKKKRKKELFKDLDVDLDSDHPVHEEFVEEKGLREALSKIKKKRKY